MECPSVQQLINQAAEEQWEELNLSRMRLVILPESIGKLTKLTVLNLQDNRLTALPESIGKLSSLVTLNLRDNRLAALPESIGKLINLTALDLTYNQLTTLPEPIEKLVNLTDLYIRYNSLKTLPESFGRLAKLTTLDFASNRLIELPESIGNLAKIRTLNCSYNSLTELPDSIGNLVTLETFNCSYNSLTELPDSIGNLVTLKTLNIRWNKLTLLPDSIINLTKLTTFDLAWNQLYTLPESIGDLTKLATISLRDNQLTLLPESIGDLTKLTDLDLRHNRLISLPESVGKLVRLNTLDIDKKLLMYIPPEVSGQGGLAIRDYFIQRLEENTDYIYEAKLLIVGEGGAGKTSLANKIIDSQYELKLTGSSDPEKSTEGIDILHFNFSYLESKIFRINIWDFGGQEIYYATHQFFLTKRSIYLLVVDTRQGNIDLNYWLEVIELLSAGSPTIIVKNEKQDRLCQVNASQLHGRFPEQLKAIFSTNLATNRGLTKILTAIQHHTSQLPHIGTPLPKTWVRVREALETNTQNYITQAEFLSLCATHGFKRQKDKLQLSGYLHDLGVFLHFKDDPVLKNWVILKPEWGTTAVYAVFRHPKSAEKLWLLYS